MLACGLGWSLAALAARAENRTWHDERVVGPFVVHADYSLSKEQPLLAELTLLREQLFEQLGVPKSDTRIHLYLFHDRTTFQRYLKQYFPRVPYRRAMYIKSRGGPGSVFAHRNGEFAIDLRHETTHALLHASLNQVPLWLDEGLAEYFEVAADDRRQRNPHLADVRRDLAAGASVSLAELEAIRDFRRMGKAEYRYAFAWVHFMVHGPPAARRQLREYLQQLQKAGDPGPLETRLSRHVPQLRQTFRQHFQPRQ